MVDVRPLLFINALALMLLVTAGFASIRSEVQMTETFEPPTLDQTLAAKAVSAGEPPAPARVEPGNWNRAGTMSPSARPALNPGDSPLPLKPVTR